MSNHISNHIKILYQADTPEGAAKFLDDYTAILASPNGHYILGPISHFFAGHGSDTLREDLVKNS